jgi:PucR-like helix-turn-helix protein/diguanylate cyclase with GGDEF domain
LLLLAQARAAARSGLPVGSVLRHCSIGCNQLVGFLIEEAEGLSLLGPSLRELAQELSALFERLLDELEREFERECHEKPSSAADRLANQVKRRLTGDLVELDGVNYDFGGHHLAIVAAGPAEIRTLRTLAEAMNGRFLSVRPDGQSAWIWIGTRNPIDRARLDHWLAANWPAESPLGLSEPAEGSLGWRLSHEQAREAYPFSRRQGRRPVRYSEIAVKAAIERSALASTSLRQLYMSLFRLDEPDSEKLRRTLRAYLDSGHNGASAAAALGLTRQTVSNHIRKIEERFGRSLTRHAAELEMALWLAELDSSPLVDGCQP